MTRDLRLAAILAAVMVAAAGLAVLMTPTKFMADQQRRERLSAIVPTSFAGWQVDRSMVPIPPSPDLQRVLDATYDETLALTFRNAQGQRVMLSMAYGRNQHKGMNTHRPEICYPAQGFKLLDRGGPQRLNAAGRDFSVTRLVAGMGPRIEPISYWLLVGDQLTPFGYAQRWVTIRHGLKGVVPDGVLVRVSTIDADVAHAFALQTRFIQDLLAALSPEQRARLIGPV